MSQDVSLLLKKESRAAMSSRTSNQLMLSQHTVDGLEKSHVPITDDSYKYSYQRTPDGYGTVVSGAA